MSELNKNPNRPFKEAVCIEAMRVYDSCCSQDCLEDLEFTFDEEAQETINGASYIKTKCLKLTGVTFGIDSVPFNKGFYAVDVQYNIRADIEAYTPDATTPTVVYGNGTFSKKVILYGGCGGSHRFTSDQITIPEAQRPVSGCAACCDNGSAPIAAANVAPLMCLDTKLVPPVAPETDSTVQITIGIFAIIQLERPVPIMVPSFDYCMPDRRCSTNTDTPCELFDKIAFPVNEFFPKGIEDRDFNCCENEADTPDNKE